MMVGEFDFLASLNPQLSFLVSAHVLKQPICNSLFAYISLLFLVKKSHFFVALTLLILIFRNFRK